MSFVENNHCLYKKICHRKLAYLTQMPYLCSIKIQNKQNAQQAQLKKRYESDNYNILRTNTQSI